MKLALHILTFTIDMLYINAVYVF